MRDLILKAGFDPSIPGASGLLRLAATPVFGLMALATRDGGMPDMPGMAASPLNGMALMYLLMAVFHATPWLGLFARSGKKHQI
ncbi:MAG: hypothetical protein J0I19_11985 [Alphaproteobacteria bacterium]|nr:hypothetical protein [Alphaproteobacteria bacterium]